MQTKIIYLYFVYLIMGIVLGIMLTHGFKSAHTLNSIEYANYKTLEYKVELIEAYQEYYNNTEKYLDELNTYIDISNGSDIECNYQESKDKVKYLQNLEY